MTLRSRIHQCLDGDQPNERGTVTLRLALAVLIVANVAATVLETVPAVAQRLPRTLAVFEWCSVVVFSVEFLARLWVAPERTPERGALSSRLRWLLSPGALIDLLAVLPSWLPWFGLDLRSVRILRLLRILRIAKLGRHSHAVQTLQNVLRDKAPDLLSLLAMLLAMLVVSSTVMYHCEHDAQPAAFSSIPATMWWGIVTLTTIGYGDMSPVTPAGRAFGGVVAILGIAMFALPAGLLGAAFVEELGKARTRAGGFGSSNGPRACPHCGQHLDGPPPPTGGQGAT